MKRQAGVSLVELMIAMVLGLVVLLGVTQVYSHTKDLYIYTEGFARVQENGLMAMHWIRQEGQRAGWVGCAPTTVVNHLNNPGDYLPGGGFLRGHAYTGGGGSALSDWTPPLVAAMFDAGDVEPFTDVVVITRATEGFTRVDTPFMTSTSAALHIEQPNNLQRFDIVMVTDCLSADIFQVTAPGDPDQAGTVVHSTGSVQQGPGNATGDLSKVYGSGARIVKLMTRAFFIGRLSPGGQPNLYMMDLDDGLFGPGELAGSIKTLWVDFLVDADSNGSADVVLSADLVTDWTKVLGVNVQLQAETPTVINGGRPSWPFGGTVTSWRSP